MASPDTLRLLLADLILVLHFTFVLFVIGGLMCIVAGRFIRWRWIYFSAFRYLHLGAIGIVVGQAWLGRLCPLTIWESALRAAAGQTPYENTFVQHWLARLLYFDFPFWVFSAVYTVFGILVAAALYVDRKRLVRWQGGGHP